MAELVLHLMREYGYTYTELMNESPTFWGYLEMTGEVGGGNG